MHVPTVHNKGSTVCVCRYNLVVIGAGAGGLVTAAGAAGVGARVAIIEEHLMGGDCLNVGCVPSKALIRCARAAHEVGLLIGTAHIPASLSQLLLEHAMFYAGDC